jgi:lipopolysaccharide/colanic/teichoic acid biosynthesis glycosyltransferase
MVLKRWFDVSCSLAALLFLSPIMLLSGVAIALTSRGPIIYRARRTGRNGVIFVMYKFRTMHVHEGGDQSAITAPNDRRIFPIGNLLRKLKIDELPQLWNVVLGQMSIVGPRPEDPEIVENDYTALMRETLVVRPGLASPGSLFGSTHGDGYLSDDDPQGSYVRQLLPLKMAIELVYVRNRSFGYDINIICRTVTLLARTALGAKNFAEPPELAAARDLLVGSFAIVPAKLENAECIPPARPSHTC